MGTNLVDIAPQLDFIGWGVDGKVGNVRELVNKFRHKPRRGPFYDTDSFAFLDEKLLYQLHRRVMRHTMTQRRNGRSLLDLPPRRDRVIKISFLQDEKTAYDAIAGDVKIIWEKLVDQNAVQSNMIQALACLSKLQPLQGIDWEARPGSSANCHCQEVS